MSNVDHAEIAKFEALAHRWWDRESEFKPLHDINPLRVNWVDERVKLAGKKVLDVAGNGRFVRNVLEAAEVNRSARLDGANLQSLSDEEMFCLLPEDIAPAVRRIVDPLLGRHHTHAADPATTES